jgi:hypothetical protein
MQGIALIFVSRKGEESPSIEEEGVTTEGNDKKKAKRGSGGAGKR